MIIKTGHLKRIALLGAESTGKTTLARSLALRFQTVWVQESAHELYTAVPGKYKVSDVEKIAHEQLAVETRLMHNANQFIFVDSELITFKVWCVDAFGKSPGWMDDAIRKHQYDLYLLTANDLPWVPDPLRLNAQRREYFFNWYKRELENYNLPYEIVTGRYEARLLNAIMVLRKHFGIVE